MKKDDFPKLSFNDRMNLFGYAKYMGYEFDYDPGKRRAILVKTDNEERNVLYIAKERGKIIGTDKNGNKEMLSSQINITRILNKLGIFKIPDNADIGVNEYILKTLNTIGIK